MYNHKNTFAIGGLDNVGYVAGQDYLMVLSSQGEGLFDCLKGEKIARQSNEADWWNRFDQATGAIEGFDRFKETEIQTYGLYGSDSLPKNTADGWRLIITDP